MARDTRARVERMRERERGFTLRARASANDVRAASFEASTTRARAVTLEDVEEFAEANRRAANEARATALANAALAVTLAWSALERLVAWIRARRAARGGDGASATATEGTTADGAETETETETETR